MIKEAVTQKCSLKHFRKFMENLLCWSLFYKKVPVGYSCIPVKFAKSLRAALAETCELYRTINKKVTFLYY